ncbi:FRG domain-containing protein [Shewanella sp.]|uniref:FRG domain-containing protein n=1 Tax=Shewanella sp. TaxID=50422 RepID=UPI003D12A825
MTSKGIKEIKHESTTHLWEALRPENYNSETIFRGQRDSRWRLVPSIYREPNSMLADQSSFFEWQTIKSFINCCDKQGLSFYGDSPEFREKYLTELPQKYGDEWPYKELINILAVCQHHGIPTRLLDWTKRPYVAAYFAASTALEYIYQQQKENNDVNLDDKYISIWSLDLNYINLEKKIEIASVPGTVSPNLMAQSGLLMFMKEKIEMGKPFPNEPLDTKILTEDCEITKHLISIRKILEILELCEKYNINTSTMFPGYDGAAKYVTQQFMEDKVRLLFESNP